MAVSRVLPQLYRQSMRLAGKLETFGTSISDSNRVAMVSALLRLDEKLDWWNAQLQRQQSQTSSSSPISGQWDESEIMGPFGSKVAQTGVGAQILTCTEALATPTCAWVENEIVSSLIEHQVRIRPCASHCPHCRAALLTSCMSVPTVPARLDSTQPGCNVQHPCDLIRSDTLAKFRTSESGGTDARTPCHLCRLPSEG